MKSSLIDTLMKILFIIVSILLVYWMLQVLLGRSPELSQINAALIVSFISVMFFFMSSLSNLNREIGELKVDMRHGFDRVKEEFGRGHEDFIGVREDIKSIKDDISKIGK